MSAVVTARDLRPRLLDTIETDTTRQPFERETCIRWTTEASRVRIDTAEKSLMRRFLNHPEFELESFAARHGERSERSFGPDADGWEGEDVLSVRGTLPIGCVSVKSSPRNGSSHANVVSRKVLEGDSDE